MKPFCVFYLLLLSSKVFGQQHSTVIFNSNSFTLDFYAELAAGQQGNIFLSPFSVSTAMAMIYPGSAGRSAEEIRSTLQFLENVDKQNELYSQALAELNKNGSPLIINNALWTQKGLRYTPEFVSINTNFFGSSLRPVDFIRDAQGVTNEINSTIEQQTKGKIKNLIPADGITTATRLVLTNAIYFKDAWAFPFDKSLSSPGDFKVTPANTIVTTFMNHSGSFNGFENNVVSIIDLPYKNGNYYMSILLPKIDLAEFEKIHLTADNLLSWNMIEVPFSKIKLPKFKFEISTDVTDVLKKMGMNAPFNDGEADFSRITDEASLYISGVFHKAFVEVNEEGTEAAASTAVTGALRSARPREREFIADRPFIFMIRESSTDAIVFIGRVNNPTVAGK
jgi:serpin B